jgi:predicted nucleotidyltransferase component of viral defense system
MIPQDFISEWRENVPWIQDSQVEQDLIISRALIELYSQSTVVNALAFRGGTAVYKLHLDTAARYSEDIDLVQRDPSPIGPILSAVRESLDPWLGTPRRAFKEGGATLVYRMQSEGPPALPMRLKIEINTREHFSLLGLVDRVFTVESRWFSGSASIRTYRLEELMGTKMRALYQRRKGRDLFDLWAVHSSRTVDPERIVQCFLQYLSHGGHRISRAEFEANLEAKLAEPVFLQDIESVLAPSVEWDLNDAVRYVQEELVSRIPGEPWREEAASTDR